MQKIKNKLSELSLKAQLGLYNLLNNEDGDTNFISIAIILIIILGVAVIFIAFKNKIMGGFNNATKALYTALGI